MQLLGLSNTDTNLVLFAYKVAALSHTSLVQVAHSLHTLSFLPLGL